MEIIKKDRESEIPGFQNPPISQGDRDEPRTEMYFETLRGRLLECIRKRVQNGEVTERRLAGLSGISQPHIHNLLKGARSLSPEVADRILRTLDMSVLDLLALEEAPWPERGPSKPTETRGAAGFTPEDRRAGARRRPRWLNRASGTVPPHDRSPGPAWPSETN